jgi:hypothetical protein
MSAEKMSGTLQTFTKYIRMYHFFYCMEGDKERNSNESTYQILKQISNGSYLVTFFG